MLTDFQNSFTDRFISKFATKPLLIIPPRLSCVTTLPCEIPEFKKLPCSRPESMKQAVMQKLSYSEQLLKFLTVILELFSSLTKRYTEWPYLNSHSMTVCICCDAEEKYCSKMLLHMIRGRLVTSCL